MKENTQNHLIGIGKASYKLGDHHKTSIGHLWAFGGTNYSWLELIRSKPNVRLIDNICVLCLLLGDVIYKP
jgi:hypothetical protein